MKIIVHNVEAEASLVGVRRSYVNKRRSKVMLYWAVIFLIVAIVAAVFGFGGIAAGAATIAKVLFFVFLVVFVISLIAGLARRHRHA